MTNSGSRFELGPARRSAHAAVIALAAGTLLGPFGLRLVHPQLSEDAAAVQTLTEIALLTLLFCLGLRLRTALEWRLWRVPLRLATATTLATAALAAAAAHLLFDMSLGEAVLLGVIVAPLDSVIASEAGGADFASLGRSFVLAAESGINNGVAVALLLVVLGFLGLNDSQIAAPGWVAVLALLTAGGGFATGWLIGAAMAHWIRLLDPERQAEFLEEALVFATAVLAYGVVLAIHLDGFLAVFAAGIALSHGGRVRRPPRNRPLMPRVLRIAAGIEKTSWLAILVLLGVLIAGVEFKLRMLVFAAVLLILIRPLAVRLGLASMALPENQWRGIAWFPARGVASLYCLAFALNHGLSAPFGRQLAGITCLVVVTSVVASAIGAFPLSRASAGTVDL